MKKILIIRNDRFGEFLLNIPALRALRDTYPDARLDVAVAPGLEELVTCGLPWVDRVLVLPPGPQSLLDLLRRAGRLRREHYDAALVLNPSKEMHQLVFAAGIPVRAGYARKHAFLLTHTLPDRKHLGLWHEVDSNLELAALLGARTADRALSLSMPGKLRAEVRIKFALDVSMGLVAVHPWTSDPVKQWPLENFLELTRMVASSGRVRVVIIGRPEPWHASVNFSGPGVIDLAGRTSLIEAAAVLKDCQALVSCDSGPVHLAASVGTPVVVLFRNDMPGKNPERWRPWGDGHRVVQGPRLEQLTVLQVRNALESLVPALGAR